jgi:hypothetical protein
MFKSQTTSTTQNADLLIDMGSTYKIISLYMSLEESDPEQHVGMEVWIGSGTQVTSTLCYQVS